MMLRLLRGVVGGLLVGSGALMFHASWQRWSDACGWDDLGSEQCGVRQDHLYDVVRPYAPWEPVGDAAQWAGASLLVLALALVLLPWALTGRRPGILTAVAQVAVVVATTAVGVASIRSGLTGLVVEPPVAGATDLVWLVVTPALLVRLAIGSRGWSLASAVALVLGTPLVAGVSYAVGPYDAQPWYEAISGLLTATGGLCLLGAAVVSGGSAGAGSAPSRTQAVATATGFWQGRPRGGR